jgi:hypothetical protein
MRNEADIGRPLYRAPLIKPSNVRYWKQVEESEVGNDF